jgi:hypothetical protein
MKRLVGVLIIIILLGCASATYAFTPPTTVSDNASSVVLWHGDNVTLSNVTVNITGLQTSLVAASQAHATAITQGINSIVNQVEAFLFVLFITILAYWHRDKWLYILSGFILIIYGFSLGSTNLLYSIIFVLAGIYSFIKLGDSRHEKG